MGLELFVKGTNEFKEEVIINLKNITKIKKQYHSEYTIQFSYEKGHHDILYFESEIKRNEFFDKVWRLLRNSNYEIEDEVK